MLTFIKSLITYIAWLQKVTFLQKGTKAIYSIIEFIHNQGNRAFFRDQKTSSTAALAEFGEQPLPPHTLKGSL